MPTERKLAAMLLADVVGYSRPMAEDEAGTIQRLGAYQHELSGLVGDHRGRVVDATGARLGLEDPSPPTGVCVGSLAQDASA